MRGYNYRMFMQEKFVKQRILNIAYNQCRYKEYIRFRRWRHIKQDRYNYSLRDPEDKWFNYLGEYTKEYRKSKTFNARKDKTYWGDEWKMKYSSKRSKLKRNQLSNIDEQIGERYYIFNK